MDPFKLYRQLMSNNVVYTALTQNIILGVVHIDKGRGLLFIKLCASAFKKSD